LFNSIQVIHSITTNKINSLHTISKRFSQSIRVLYRR